MPAIVTAVESRPERDHNGHTGQVRTTYTVMRGTTEYEVYAQHRGSPWEIVRLAKRADGGRNWIWFKGEAAAATGAWGEVLAAAKAQHVEDATAAEYVAETARDATGRALSVSLIQKSAAAVDAGNAGTCVVQPAAPTPDTTLINVQLKVSDQFLRDVLCTAAEGGSNYWAGFRCVKTHEGEYGKEWEAASVKDYGEGDGTQETKVIGLAELRRGVAVMLERGKCADQYKGTLLGAILADDAGDVDAELADLVLQATFFDGDVVYG